MRPSTLIDSKQLELIIERLSHQLIENHDDFSESVLLGIQPRGIYLANRIQANLKRILGSKNAIRCGQLDITFYRDDFRRRESPLEANTTNLDFIIEDKRVILIDDVLYTGRTIRAAMDAMLAYGRPKEVELLILIDRRFSRQLPIESNYVGMAVDSLASQRVKVQWAESEKEDKVLLYSTEEKNV